MRHTPKRILFFAALFLAVGISIIIPTPNNVNGGTAKMLFIIFATVLFKAIFEWTWGKVFKK